MNKQDTDRENRELEKIVELLTPRFQRKCEFSFTKPHKRFMNKIWTISGIAAMFVVVLTIAIKSVHPVSAKEVIDSAFSTLTRAESVKVEFVMRGIKTSAEEIYTPDPSGKMIDGTLYLLRKNGKVNIRIDWHDTEKNSIILNGIDYIHFRNNRIINRYPSPIRDKLMYLFCLDSLPDDLKDKSILSTDGNMIIMESHKNDITLCGEFQRESKRLIKASATIALSDTQEMTLLKTNSIEINISIPESVFPK